MGEIKLLIAEIEERISAIQPLLKAFENINLEIIETDESHVKDEDSFEFENKYFKAISEAKQLIQKKGIEVDTVAQANSNQNKPDSISIKLPEISIPAFSGAFTEWISFRDCYKSLIHDNQSLNPVQKFHYLRGSLTGDAQKTISHLAPTTDNYLSAWDLLTERYENKRIISQHHIRALFSLPHINSRDSKSLRSSLQIVNSNIKALDAIGRPTMQWDDLLVYLISSTFDESTTIAWESLTSEQRISECKKRKLCINCLRSGHKVENCNSSNCRKCNRRHNTLLHVDLNQNNSPQPSSSSMTFGDDKIQGKQFRALLDNGSVSNFITERAVKKLNLRNIHNIQLPLIGIGCNSSVINHAATIQIASVCSSFKATLDFLIVPEITGNVPNSSFPTLQNLPDNIKLADPFYNLSQPVEILIGNEIFWNIICIGQIRIHRHGPVLQKTQFGWVIAGVLNNFNTNTSTSCNLSNTDLDVHLKKFWELEEVTNISDQVFPGDNRDPCEKVFIDTFTRDLYGRFQVKLHIINEPPDLRSSKEIALKLFYNLEKRLRKDHNLFEQYSKFMADYLDLGHMTQINYPDESGYFVSHHPVYNESSLTTKLRVVFNASLKTTNHKSINENLMVGPNLQQDLFSILIRFRIHKVVITADVKKMYRQILVHPDHRKYQQIFWRFNSTDEIKVFELNTVTYGFASSSYLATRCLQELAKIEKQNFPEAANIILRDFYVDDLIYGANDINHASQILNDIKGILSKGGFELHKINSNHLPCIDSTSTPGIINLDKQAAAKTLGLFWNNCNDTIQYSICLKNPKCHKITKRGVLSTIAQIFDPLGLVAPVTVTAKIIMQKLWSLKLNWDESLPAELHTLWCEFLNAFPELTNISIPRHVVTNKHQIEIHGFCDSSQNAYGACVYLRSQNPSGNYEARILCSKNRVAPLQTQTIPRLELCGAVLLARLVHKVKQSLINFDVQECHYWTDSTIVLAWIRTQPTLLKPFVSHRISEIQSLTPENNWHHVSSEQNPADILSRGDNPRHLQSFHLWWNGPTFLTRTDLPYEHLKDSSHVDLPELKLTCCLATKNSTEFLLRYSDFDKLCRITAIIMRFIQNLRSKDNKKSGNVTSKEIIEAHNLIIKLVQKEAFQDDIHQLKLHNQITSNSKLKALNPFIDNSGFLRVGGRLNHAKISNDRKHQLLLPRDHFVTRLIIEKYHKDNLHIGCQGTLSAVRCKYWPISAKNTIRRTIFKCLKCYRCKPVPFSQLMGDLPKTRVTPSRPFFITGVDYGGPFILKNGHGRTQKTIKGYVAVFVCFSTRAVHIELVCECSSLAFLNALKRFISRRGQPHELHSDNGTNFVGANRYLKELFQLFRTKSFENVVLKSLTNMGINWQFIPPHAPHMGGIWEAAIKSVKGHLKRILGNALLNYEEMNTILIMIEACLNSRPITPLSNDPNDLSALTPAHFLIGGPLTAPAEEDCSDIPTNRLIRYQLLEKIRQDFWRRWSREYLHSLQHRAKWQRVPARQPQIGDLVIICEDGIPPQQWPLGRIQELHPGSDNQCRVATVKTVRGVHKRPVTKLCAVPVQ
ncbi:uncharacterized protein LOC135129432 [Zophobas morio]|uniref:uncharacterized protein LOC135129432 n=1 Tax=Zophobas morio TaxID=2755281 RepID=UPI003083C3FE